MEASQAEPDILGVWFILSLGACCSQECNRRPTPRGHWLVRRLSRPESDAREYFGCCGYIFLYREKATAFEASPGEHGAHSFRKAMSRFASVLHGRVASRCLRLAAGMFLLGVAALVHAAPVTTVIAEDSFVYPGGSSLVGRDGGTGWIGPWVSASPSFTDFFTNAVGLTVPGVAGAGGRIVYTFGGTQINDAARNLPMQSSGVVFLQFLSQFGTQSGGGTPSIRLLSTATGQPTGAVGNNGGCGAPVYAILGATLQPIPAACSTVPLSTLAAVVLRIDYAANITRLWVLPSLSGFDYLSPPAPSAEYAGLAPAFDQIAIYSRSPASIDELRVFRVADVPASIQPVPAISPWALGILTMLLVWGGRRFGRRGR